MGIEMRLMHLSIIYKIRFNAIAKIARVYA